MIVQILTTQTFYPNSFACFLPLHIWKKYFIKNNINIKIVKDINLINECEVLIIDSKFHRNLWKNNIENIYSHFDFFKKKCNKLIYFDTTDSTGSIQTELLDIVDIYWKSQIYCDKKKYLIEYFGERIFTDHLKNLPEFSDEKTNFSKRINNPLHLKKIYHAWNTSFANYTFYGNLYNKLLSKFSLNSLSNFNQKFIEPENSRPNLISSRYNTKYSRKLIAWQREKIPKILEKKVNMERISAKKYHDELSSSKISIAPFGWGEISYRDYETINSGAILFKPNMSHLETWPNFYQEDITYRSFSWDLKNLNEKITETLDNYKEYINIAINAQNIYKKYTINKGANEIFIKRFLNLIK